MVTLADFTERQLLSDYKFLEEAARVNDVALRSEVPRPARQLPHGLQMFVDEVMLLQATGMLAHNVGSRKLHMPDCMFVLLQAASMSAHNVIFTFDFCCLC